MTLFGLLFLALTIAAILYFTATPAMNARTIRFAVVAGLALAALNMTAARAENIEVVAGADGCTTTYSQIFDAEGAAVTAVTLVCPRPLVQVAETDAS
jgi:hypothetical protein